MHLSPKTLQQQILAPSLQQGLLFLQAPLQEVNQLIHEEVNRNPILELDSFRKDSLTPSSALSLKKESLLHDENELKNSSSLLSPTLLQAKRDYFFSLQQTEETLASFLASQLASFSKEEEPIALWIIGNLDDQGYLRATTEEIANFFHLSEKEIENIICKIQELEPPGVGARNLQESLLIQLERKKQGHSLAYRLVKYYLSDLADKKYEELLKKLKISQKELQDALSLIMTLNPTPGSTFFKEPLYQIIPDAIIWRENNEVFVRLNEESLLPVTFQSEYKNLLYQESHQEGIKEYLKQKITQARTFLSHLEGRKKTLFLVAQKLVEKQSQYFLGGNLSPLNLEELAQELHLHSSTLSRAISGKWFDSPLGLIAWKDLLSTKATHNQERAISNHEIKNHLQILIQRENPLSPLSDQELQKLLLELNISVSRRTIAFYREELKIPAKQLRKREYQLKTSLSS